MKDILENKRQMNLSIIILLSLIFIAVAIVIMNSASATIAPPGVTKDATPTDINVKGTGFDEITTITIEVTGAGGTTTTTVPMDIVFSIDSSGSMTSSDPSGLRKTAAISFLGWMDSSIDTAGVISWDMIYPPTWPTGIDFTFGLSNDFDNVNGVEYWINQIDASGGTDLNLGLNAAIAMLDANPRVGPSAEAIIFLTDGHGSYTPSGYPGSPADNALFKGYKIYTIGLGSGHNPAALQEIALVTGGQYFNAPTAANLLTIFNTIYTQIVISTIPHYVDVIEVTQSCIVDEGSFNIAPDSVSTVGGITTIIWNNIGLLSGDGDPDLSGDEIVTLAFEAKSDCCQQNLPVDVYGTARVEYDDNNGVYAGTVLIPQEYINVDCDTTPPETLKTHGPCVMYDPSSGIWYMKPCNPIYLYARDLIPLATGVQFLHYELWWDVDCDGIYDVKKLDVTVYDNDPNDLNPIPWEIDVELHIDQECCHMLIWYAVDNFGNQEIPHEQHYRMDGTPPTITKTHPDPCYSPISPTEGLIKIGSDIVLNAIDGGIPPCISGVNAIYWGFELNGIWHPTDITDTYYGNIVAYFKDGKWWYIYSQPIKFHEICKHILEYWAIDNVCNNGTTHSQTYWVNDCKQEVHVDDNFGFHTPGWWHTHFQWKQMALDWLGPGGTAYMYDGTYGGDISIDAVPCCDNTGITQMGEYGCFPTTESAVITGTETIKVRDVTIKYLEYSPNTAGSIIVEPNIGGTLLRCNKFRKDCIANAIGVKALGDSIVNARLNWWGRPDGPNGGIMEDGKIANGQGVQVIGNVFVEPWLGVHAEIAKPIGSSVVVDVGETVLFNSAGSFAYTFGECCQEAEELPMNILWDFDDGAYSMEKQIAHVFDSPGTYHVSLRIHSYDSRLWGEFMFDWAYLTVTVVNPGAPLEANADGNDFGGYETIIDEELQLFGLATGGTPPYTYNWEFGDDTVGTLQNPTHVYSETGTYTATLEVIDSVGATATDTTEILVHDIGEFIVNIVVDKKTVANLETPFSASVIGGMQPYSYEWDFGDGAISTEENPIYKYEETGDYTVTLTVTDSENVKITDSVVITVEEGDSDIISAEIKQVNGGFGIKAIIAAGDIDCDWRININGKTILFGGESSGIIPANNEEKARLPLTVAFGKVNIEVIANEIQKDYTAIALGPFFLNLQET